MCPLCFIILNILHSICSFFLNRKHELQYSPYERDKDSIWRHKYLCVKQPEFSRDTAHPSDAWSLGDQLDRGSLENPPDLKRLCSVVTEGLPWRWPIHSLCLRQRINLKHGRLWNTNDLLWMSGSFVWMWRGVKKVYGSCWAHSVSNASSQASVVHSTHNQDAVRWNAHWWAAPMAGPQEWCPQLPTAVSYVLRRIPLVLA